ncbi:unnamed protein product [Trichobilharzia regenti]|nr:unnamed protein product [Trichobilharzia regenti]
MLPDFHYRDQKYESVKLFNYVPSLSKGTLDNISACLFDHVRNITSLINGTYKESLSSPTKQRSQEKIVIIRCMNGAPNSEINLSKDISANITNSTVNNNKPMTTSSLPTDLENDSSNKDEEVYVTSPIVYTSFLVYALSLQESSMVSFCHHYSFILLFGCKCSHV